MKQFATSALFHASIAEYLNSLRESGVDGIPVQTTEQLQKNESVVSASSREEFLEEAHDKTVPVIKPDTLEKIRKNLGDCQRCKLGKTRKNLVFGVGNPHARLVFVGEGPGADEDRLGEPFVGEAGRLLDRIINAMGLQRSDVYICNVVKCRPPGNRDPEVDEIAACSPFLLRQVQSIKPEVVVALGKVAAQMLLGSREPISRIRGKFHDFHGIPLMPTYHPAFLKRKEAEGNKEAFWEVWDDMSQVLRLLKLPVPEKGRKKN